MKIGIKIFITSAFTILLITVAVYFILSTITMQNIVRIEQDRTRSNVLRVQDAIYENMNSLNSTTTDYSIWDDSYKFVLGNNENYTQSAVNPGTLLRIKVNFLFVINNSGNILFARGADSETERDLSIGDATYDYFRNYGISLKPNSDDDTKNGFITLTDGVAIISISPILTSDGAGPSPGFMVMGRMLDENLLGRFASQTHTNITAYAYGDQLPGNVDAMKHKLDITNPVAVNPISENAINGYLLLYDVHQKPVLILQTFESRSIFAQGKESMSYVILSLVIIGIISDMIFIFLINKFLINDLKDMDSKIKNIGDKNITSTRLAVKGDDELSAFANTLNKALDSIDKMNEEKQAIFEANPDAYFYIDASGKILDFKFSSFLDHEKELKEAKEVSLSIFFGPEIIGKILTLHAESARQGLPVTFEFLVTLNGLDTYLEFRVAAMKDDKSLVIVRDITKAKNVESEIIKKNDDLETFNKFATDRELKMIDLKKQVEEMNEKLHQGIK